jgi:hypothetical protein
VVGFDAVSVTVAVLPYKTVAGATSVRVTSGVPSAWAALEASSGAKLATSATTTAIRVRT